VIAVAAVKVSDIMNVFWLLRHVANHSTTARAAICVIDAVVGVLLLRRRCSGGVAVAANMVLF